MQFSVAALAACAVLVLGRDAAEAARPALLRVRERGQEAAAGKPSKSSKSIKSKPGIMAPQLAAGKPAKSSKTSKSEPGIMAPQLAAGKPAKFPNPDPKPSKSPKKSKPGISAEFGGLRAAGSPEDQYTPPKGMPEDESMSMDYDYVDYEDSMSMDYDYGEHGESDGGCVCGMISGETCTFKAAKDGGACGASDHCMDSPTEDDCEPKFGCVWEGLSWLEEHCTPPDMPDTVVQATERRAE